MSQVPSASQNAPHQRDYFSVPARKYTRMSPIASPYVARHLEATLAALDLAPGARILELGAGMGRFSLPLAERGFEVVATDLSPHLLAELRRFDSEGKVKALEADAFLVDQVAPGPFDAVLGFFSSTISRTSKAFSPPAPGSCGRAGWPPSASRAGFSRPSTCRSRSPRA